MPIKPSWVNDRFLSTRILTDSKIDGRQTKWPWSGNEFWSGPDFFFGLSFQCKEHEVTTTRGCQKKNIDLVSVGNVEGFSALGNESDDARAPRNTDLVLLLHLLGRRLGTHVEQFRDEAARLGAALALHQEQRTPVRIRQDAHVLVV